MHITHHHHRRHHHGERQPTGLADQSVAAMALLKPMSPPRSVNIST